MRCFRRSRYNVPDFASGSGGAEAAGECVGGQTEHGVDDDGRDLLDFRLHKISQPMLIVWGAQDELIPLSVGETIHESVPQSVLDVIEGCGHLAPCGVRGAGDGGDGGVS